MSYDRKVSIQDKNMSSISTKEKWDEESSLLSIKPDEFIQTKEVESFHTCNDHRIYHSNDDDDDNDDLGVDKEDGGNNDDNDDQVDDGNDSDGEVDELDDPLFFKLEMDETDPPVGHIRLRPSQYKNIPSTVFMDYPKDLRMSRKDTSIIKPLDISSKLRYRCAWERYCLRHTFQRNFFKKSDKTWTIYWGKHMSSSDLKDLNCIQKINHFPSSWCIGRKDRLARTINMMKRIYHKDYNFHPDTYVLPEQREALLRRFRKNLDSKSELYIVKPVASSCGRGIKVKTQEDIHRLLIRPSNRSLLVQKYLRNPYLIDGKKFDLRIYVLVAGVDPLRVYICQEGLTRLSTSNYSLKDIKNRFSHLTNYSVNKKSELFKVSSMLSSSSSSSSTFIHGSSSNSNNNDNSNNNLSSPRANSSMGSTDTDTLTTDSNISIPIDNNHVLSGTDGFKWSLSAFRDWLSKKESVEKVKETFDKIYDLCVKTMIAAESELTTKLHTSVNYRTNCFELFGCDVILNDKLEPSLLEVNVSPSLMSSSQLDRHIKGMLIADVLHIVGTYPHDDKLIKSDPIDFNSPSTLNVISNISSSSSASATTTVSSSSLSSSSPSSGINPFTFITCSKLLLNQDRWRREPSITNVDFSNLTKESDSMLLWPMLLSIDDEINRSLSTQFKCYHPAPDTVIRYNQIYRSQRFLDHVLGYWVLHGGSTGRLRSFIPSMYQKEGLYTPYVTKPTRVSTASAVTTSATSSRTPATTPATTPIRRSILTTPNSRLKTFIPRPRTRPRTTLRQQLHNSVMESRKNFIMNDSNDNNNNNNNNNFLSSVLHKYDERDQSKKFLTHPSDQLDRNVKQGWLTSNDNNVSNSNNNSNTPMEVFVRPLTTGIVSSRSSFSKRFG